MKFDLTPTQLAAFMTALVVCGALVALGKAHPELMGSPFAMLVPGFGARSGSGGNGSGSPAITNIVEAGAAPRGPSQLLGRAIFVCSFVTILTLASPTVSCKSPRSPTTLVEAGTGVATGVCSLLEGIDDDGAIRNICATVDEIAQVIAFVTTLRTKPDAARPDAAIVVYRCENLPGTTFCATSSERAKAVLFLVRARMARFTLEPPPEVR